MPQIEHIVVLMMENQSFDSIIGMLPEQAPTRHGWTGSPWTPGAARRRSTRAEGRHALEARPQAIPNGAK